MRVYACGHWRKAGASACLYCNMEELKSALTQRAIEQHTRRVRESLRAHEGRDSRYSSYGMGFVQFAAQEKQLFR